MTDHSRYLRKFLGNRKGFSGLIATIFMVLVALFLCFGVFAFVLDRNTAFQDVVSQVQQMDVDRSTEQITVSDVSIQNYTAVEDSVNVSCVITNTGPLSVELVRLWVQDDSPSAGTPNYNSSDTSIILQPGNSTTFSRSVKIDGAKFSDEFTLWFVTARGNRIPFNPSQGTGDFVPDYRSVEWAQCTYTEGQWQVGNWNNSRILPADSNVTWRIDVTYYGQESLTIDGNSMLFFVPLARDGEPENYASLTCYMVSYTRVTPDTGYISSYGYGNEVTVTPSIGGSRRTLYFGSPNHSLGGVGGISSQDIADIGGGMMSLTIYGTFPSNYAQSFPLFAVETGG